MVFRIGETVDPYQFHELLHQDGMATVYKAYHPVLDRFVAIKALDMNLGKDRDFIERFRREARLVVKLDSPHIMPIFDFDEENGQPYLVQKFINGQTLRTRMKSGTLSENEILTVVFTVDDGLQYDHNQGFYIATLNHPIVFISNDGKMYIINFGMAKLISSSSSLTGDMIVSTPSYMSPEQP